MWSRWSYSAKGEFPAQMLDERLSILLVQMHDDFGVAPGPQTMALAFQLPRERGESVDFPVERDPDGPVLIPEWLRAAAAADDREAGIDEEDVLGRTDVVAAAVRAAVAQGRDHPAGDGRDLFPLERELTRDSAHGLSTHSETSVVALPVPVGPSSAKPSPAERGGMTPRSPRLGAMNRRVRCAARSMAYST